MTLALVNHRLDALTIAFRVSLDEELLSYLETRAVLAKRHGRAACEFVHQHMATYEGFRREIGVVGAAWPIRKIRPLCAELASSRAKLVYDLRNEPNYRLHIQVNAPGGTHEVNDVTGEVFDAPGWTVEVVWYAERLASITPERALAESFAIAWGLGYVHEARVRRFDLCADVAGWEIRPDDVDRIVKRPRAQKDTRDDAAELDSLGFCRKPGLGPRVEPGECALATTHETGKPGARKVCGLSVGRGGALMARVYNKVLELGYQREDKRAAEMANWTARGWDGVSPVTRVEFPDPRRCARRARLTRSRSGARGRIRPNGQTRRPQGRAPRGRQTDGARRAASVGVDDDAQVDAHRLPEPARALDNATQRRSAVGVSSGRAVRDRRAARATSSIPGAWGRE